MVNNLENLSNVMASKGVVRFYAKKLSPNDNSKNQVYLGGDFETLNIIPNKGVTTDFETKGSKRDRFKAKLDFFWLNDDGNLDEAPNAQLILYPKYPEVRLSGYLQGCKNGPSEIMGNTRSEGRILFLGVTDKHKIIGYAVKGDNAIARELLGKRKLSSVGIFFDLSGLVTEKKDSKKILLAELERIYLKGWIDSVKLCNDGTLAPCRSRNCGGYTLEAELGITPNGYSEPDFLGWEIKQLGVKNFERYIATSPITLMTPEPTDGIYVKKGVESFIRQFGYPDKSGIPDRMNFGGVYKAGKIVNSTGLTLVLRGFNSAKGKIEDADGGIVLITKKEIPAAIWKFSDLMHHWTRKHSQAAYVPSLCRLTPRQQYSYGSAVTMGEGTDFLLFIKALASGIVYYDPGIKLENASSANPKIKRRSQFRIQQKQLNAIYQKISSVSLVNGEKI